MREIGVGPQWRAVVETRDSNGGRIYGDRGVRGRYGSQGFCGHGGPGSWGPAGVLRVLEDMGTLRLTWACEILGPLVSQGLGPLGSLGSRGSAGAFN